MIILGLILAAKRGFFLSESYICGLKPAFDSCWNFLDSRVYKPTYSLHI